MSNVTKTSKDSYNALQPATMRDKVAAYLLQRTLQMRTTTDKEVAEYLGVPEGRVSARRNELLGPFVDAKGKQKRKPFFCYGWEWRPELMPVKYDRQTKRKVNTWSMVVWLPDSNLLERKKLTLKILEQLRNDKTT
jgi:hypothetical protein